MLQTQERANRTGIHLWGSARLTAQQYIDNNATEAAQSTDGFANIREKKDITAHIVQTFLFKFFFCLIVLDFALRFASKVYLDMPFLSGQSKNKQEFHWKTARISGCV